MHEYSTTYCVIVQYELYWLKFNQLPNTAVPGKGNTSMYTTLQLHVRTYRATIEQTIFVGVLQIGDFSEHFLCKNWGVFPVSAIRKNFYLQNFLQQISHCTIHVPRDLSSTWTHYNLLQY